MTCFLRHDVLERFAKGGEALPRPPKIKQEEACEDQRAVLTPKAFRAMCREILDLRQTVKKINDDRSHMRGGEIAATVLLRDGVGPEGEKLNEQERVDLALEILDDCTASAGIELTNDMLALWASRLANSVAHVMASLADRGVLTNMWAAGAMQTAWQMVKTLTGEKEPDQRFLPSKEWKSWEGFVNEVNKIHAEMENDDEEGPVDVILDYYHGRLHEALRLLNPMKREGDQNATGREDDSRPNGCEDDRDPPAES